MIFNRQELIDAIRRALKEHREAWDSAWEAEHAHAAEMRVQWLHEQGPRWRTACCEIIAKLDREELVTEKDLPRIGTEGGVYRGNIAVWTGTPNRRNLETGSVIHTPSKEYRPPRDLESLLALLDMSTDETISSSALKTLGFGNLSKIVPFLRPVTATTTKETK